MIIIDVDNLLDTLIPYEGKVDELRILSTGKVRLMKSDGTNQMISLKKLQKKKVKKRKNYHKGWTSF
jgi:hypothetical protein